MSGNVARKGNQSDYEGLPYALLKHLDLALNVLGQKHDILLEIYKVHYNNYPEDSLEGGKNGFRETNQKAVANIQVRNYKDPNKGSDSRNNEGI